MDDREGWRERIRDIRLMVQHDDDDDDIFPKGMNPKVNVIARLEFELTYYAVTVQHVSHYPVGSD